MPQVQFEDDPEVGGLHLRIYPPKANGRSNKVFYLMYGSSVDRKVYRIGAWGEWTLAEARDEARKIRRAFYDHGVDPTRAKKKRIQTGKSRLTVEELVDEYLKAKEAVWADSYMTSNKKVHAKRIVDAYGGQYAEDLRKDDVARVFLEIKKNFPSLAA